MVQRLINFWKTLFSNRRGKRSFSQCGEDLIVDFILTRLDISHPTYLDLGAHDPIFLSNTYYFYRRGASGVCVEPLPRLYRRLARVRRRDVCLNVGVSAHTSDQADFHVFESSALSTFSRAHADRYEKVEGASKKSVLKIQLMPIDDLLSGYVSSELNFVSLDVEGIELEILQHFDFGRYRPEVLCIETLPYKRERICEKPEDISHFMRDKGYFLFAYTFINSIFVDRDSWLRSGLDGRH